jgi:hypothetical protein
MLDTEIIDAWKRRGVREDDDDYEGRMNLVPPNNVAAAVERKNQSLPLPQRRCPCPPMKRLRALPVRCARLQTMPISICQRTVA